MGEHQSGSSGEKWQEGSAVVMLPANKKKAIKKTNVRQEKVVQEGEFARESA